MNKNGLGAALLVAAMVAASAPALAEESGTGKTPAQNVPIDISAQSAGSSAGNEAGPEAVQVAQARDRRQRPERPERTPQVNFTLLGGPEYLYLPTVAPVFDVNGHAGAHSPGNIVGENIDARLGIPVSLSFLPGRMQMIEGSFGYNQARRTSYSQLPFNVDAFAINGSNSSTTFGGSSANSLASELSIVQYRGELLLASKYRWCSVPLRVVTGFEYMRLEQDHNFIPLVSNSPSTAFRMSDSVDTDYYHVVGGVTAYHRFGENFQIMAGARFGLGMASSSLNGQQSFSGNDFSQNGSRDAFSANLRGTIGFDYRIMQGVRLGANTYIDYLNEVPQVIYPSNSSGSKMPLGGSDGMSWGVNFKASFNF